MRFLYSLNLAFLSFVLAAGFTSKANAQRRPAAIHGRAVNQFTREPVSFASVYWKLAGTGMAADSAGAFTVRASDRPGDSLIVSFVGYTDVHLPASSVRDSMVVFMETAVREGAVVKSKFNKGLRWWKNLVAHKAANNPSGFRNYYCQLYSKIEIDLNNVKREQIHGRKILRPFEFIYNNIDSTSEAKPFLPVFLTETLSDYYAGTDPTRSREEIKSVRASGIRNESVMQYLGGITQKINVYDNYIIILDKQFISPTSDIGDRYYNYKGADTQYINGERYLHLLFSPKHAGEHVFMGDCWLSGTDWGVKKMSLDVPSGADVNFVHRLSVIQELTRRPDGRWSVTKDKFIADISPLSGKSLSFVGRRTSVYDHIITDSAFISDRLTLNHKKEEIILADSAQESGKLSMDLRRAEPLSVNESRVYHLVDTLRSMPEFKKLTDWFTFIVDGHKKLGKIEIGPWYRWFSGNQLEKLRNRFDIGTTEEFSKTVRLYGYLAYGWADSKFKGKVAANIQLGNGWSLAPLYIHDLDNGRARNNDEDVTTDNLFSQLIRRPDIVQKFIRVDDKRLTVTKEFQNDLTVQFSAANDEFETFRPLPPKNTFSLRDNDITSTEFSLRFRYAPGEKKIVTRRRTRSLRTDNPVFDLRYSRAIPGIFKSEYTYDKVRLQISQTFRVPRWGSISYQAYGGKTWGENIPFMLLEIHPGNEIYYYNRDAFNLMNRFEFISDKYAGISLEHNLEKKLLNLLPFMRKTKVRQFWNVKTVWGDMNQANQRFNRTQYGILHLKSLEGHNYTEVGTGFENILRFFRVDFVWRFAPLYHPFTVVPTPTNPTPVQPPLTVQQHFGIFGSFRIQF